ncbi:acyl-CoA cholesterol acyltransferase [Paenibacillus aquistagni]|uniref:acyl-CoA cholesterol acyltransferase n=1 Tax=Paenibacillus aquistagni TaxID=1852522 RepID=UPI000B4FF306|nr:acyl-CoA cholesterol acyltransferase [Paenibacillus aquistagni]
MKNTWALSKILLFFRRRGSCSLRKGDRGAVSIFLIFVTMVVFSIMAVLIDYARIAAFEWRTEASAQTSIRSIMSAYEPSLQERYGLFAYGQTDPALIAEEVLSDHAPKGAEGFTWVTMEVDQHSSSITRPLGRLERFDQQIMEDMKYKAPVQVAFELIGKMKPVSGAMQEAAQTTELLNKVRKDFDKRNKELDHALRFQKQARDEAVSSDIGHRIADDIRFLYSDDPVGSISFASDIATQYADYARMVREDAELEEAEKIHGSSIKQYENGARNMSDSIRRSASRAQGRHATQIDRSIQALQQARILNQQMKTTIQQVRASQQGEGYNQVNQSSVGDAGQSDVSEQLKTVNESVDSLVLPDSFFEEYETELQKQKTSYALLDSEAGSFQSVVGSALGGGGSASGLRGAVTSMWRLWEQYNRDYVKNPNNIITDREAEISKLKASNNERRRLEKEANESLNQATSLLSTLTNMDQSLQAHRAAYQDVQAKAEAIRAYNQKPMSEGDYSGRIKQDPSDAAEQSMEGMDDLYSGLGEFMVGARERLYRNEYAFNFFTSYDPTKLKGLFTSKNPTEELIQSLSIHNQELEYVMYGYHDPMKNIAAAYGEIFAMRLAIRTMEGFVQCAGGAHPLIILACAVAKGFSMALSDMIQLVTANAVPLSMYTPNIRLSYSDFLRLFMMMHGDKEDMLIRMLALIHYNTGIDPIKQGTYGEIHLEARMKLWFLPGMMKMLGQAGALEGEVKDGYYETSRVSAYSY